jgi:hypothetical protein
MQANISTLTNLQTINDGNFGNAISDVFNVINVQNVQYEDSGNHTSEKAQQINDLKKGLEVIEKEYVAKAKPLFESINALAVKIELYRKQVKEREAAIKQSESAMAEIGTQLEHLMNQYDPLAVSFISDLKMLNVIVTEWAEAVYAVKSTDESTK